jgi:Zn-dependent metalloprotease
MKKIYLIVLSILLTVAIVTSSSPPVFALEAPDSGSAATPIDSDIKDSSPSNFISGQLTEKSDDSPEDIVKRYYSKEQVPYETNNYLTSNMLRTAEQPSSDNQFKITGQFKNSMGRTVVQTIQTYNGIPVYGTDQNYHVNNDGIIECISGSKVNDLEARITASSNRASEEDALKAVENHLGFKPEYTESPKYELVFYPVNDTYVYSYKISIKFTNPSFGNFVYYVDASSLSILEIFSNAACAEEPVDGLGIGQFCTEKSLKMVKNDQSIYYLKDMAENVTTVTGAGIAFSENDSCFDSGTPENYQKDAVDAHYNMSNVIRFFKEHFNRDGNDGKGSAYEALIDSSDSSFNAFGSENFIRFCVGHGNGVRSPACALDVSAHEFTHGMLFSEGLSLPWYVKNTEECVALHEGLSDVFATICEYYIPSDGPFDWTIAEDTGTVLRDCANPVISDYNSYLNSSKEPHSGGGVITKAAYLMAVGGSQNGTTVNAIGYDKMADIFYNTINDGYLVSEMTFRQFAEAAVQTASLAYGTGSSEVQTVKDAFVAVCIFKDLLKSFAISMRSGLRVQLSWDTNGSSADTFGIFRKVSESDDAPQKLVETTASRASVDTLIGSCDFYLAKLGSDGLRISEFSNAVHIDSCGSSPQNFTLVYKSGLQVQFAWTGTPGNKYAIYRKASESSDTPQKVAETENNAISLYTLIGSYDYYAAQIDSKGNKTSYLSQPITVRSYYLPPQSFTMVKKCGLAVYFTWKSEAVSRNAIYRKVTGSSDPPEEIIETGGSSVWVNTLPGSCEFYVAQVDSKGYRISGYSTALTVETN